MARIVDVCSKSSGLADFENTVDRGSAVIVDADSGLCLSYVPTLGPKRNLDYRSFFSLGWYSQWVHPNYFLFRRKLHLNSGVRLIGIVLCYSYQACCLLYYCMREMNSGIHMYQFTCCFCMWLWFRIEQKFWWIDGFGEKKKPRIGGFTYPSLVSVRVPSRRAFDFTSTPPRLLQILARSLANLYSTRLSPRGSTATLTMLWPNSWLISRQTHEKLTSIYFLRWQIVRSRSLTHSINYKFMCLSAYWQ